MALAVTSSTLREARPRPDPLPMHSAQAALPSLSPSQAWALLGKWYLPRWIFRFGGSATEVQLHPSLFPPRGSFHHHLRLLLLHSGCWVSPRVRPGCSRPLLLILPVRTAEEAVPSPPHQLSKRLGLFLSLAPFPNPCPNCHPQPAHLGICHFLLSSHTPSQLHQPTITFLLSLLLA